MKRILFNYESHEFHKLASPMFSNNGFDGLNGLSFAIKAKPIRVIRVICGLKKNNPSNLFNPLLNISEKKFVQFV